MSAGKYADTNVHRRLLLLGVAAGLVAGAGAAFAQAPKHDHSGHAAAPAQKPAAPAAPPKNPLKAVVDAARTCERRGQTCRAHCIRLIRRGDKSLEECLRRVDAMLPVCAATAKLAELNAPRFKDLARVCLAACEDCEAECRKHASHHAECKGCMEACQGMIAALKQVLA